MSGYYMVIGACYSCGQPFGFNPNLVPSIVVDGVRHAVCRTCIERANPIRVKKGLQPIPVLEGAYDPASELGDC